MRDLKHTQIHLKLNYVLSEQNLKKAFQMESLSLYRVMPMEEITFFVRLQFLRVGCGTHSFWILILNSNFLIEKSRPSYCYWHISF